MLSGYVLVFGGGGGIGRETGYTFAENGASGVVFADLNERAAQESANESQKIATDPNYRAISMAVDVASRETVQKTVAATVEAFGRIDYCINSAGVGVTMEKTLAEMPTDEFDRCHDVNARGCFFVLAEVSKVMLEQPESFVQSRSGKRSVSRGVIINIASGNSIIPVSGHVQYGSSKYASLGITETAAAELARKKVRVNCVLPFWVDTQMMADDFKRQTYLPGLIKELSPAGRMAQPEEIAEAIHFLCSPGASYIHGIRLVIDAGISLTRGLA